MAHVPFADAASVAHALRGRIPSSALEDLREEALRSAAGEITCFGRWRADYGKPVDWHLNPISGKRWNAHTYWSGALGDEPRVGDVKLTWEIARFPHAYRMARAGAFFPELRDQLAAALVQQIKSFVEANPFQFGVHWHSGQEIAFRHMAWLFAASSLLGPAGRMHEVEPLLVDQLLRGAAHVDAIIDYARHAVYNNHLLSEALLLYITGILFPHASHAERLRTRGRELLTEGAERQFYADGGYIQQSHTYQRVAIQDLLWAIVFARAWGEIPPRSWRLALERSIDFLVAHQNAADGRLPNYGANDGSLPSVWSVCDYTDFRPVLQAASIAVRGERLYEPGPWDESSAWLFGPAALDAPLRPPTRRSVSFSESGYRVLRSSSGESFAAFRCGSVLDRFSQIDMLHLDVWWRGQNVLVDPGSYLYNGPKKWHDHFYETGSHNTVMVDGADQMIHHRRFKNLRWTKAKLRRFETCPEWSVAEGEHEGYARDPIGCTHRRAVLMCGDDLWIVLDTILGEGAHGIRLQWLGKPGAWTYNADRASLILGSDAGDFSIQTFDSNGAPLPGDVVAGQENPPRGWLSRYYGEKEPAPSLVIDGRRSLPWSVVSVLGAGQPRVSREGPSWVVKGTSSSVQFQMADGGFAAVSVKGEVA